MRVTDSLCINNYQEFDVNFSCRNASRIVHIPFFEPVRNVAESEAEEEMKAARDRASSSISHMIAVGQHLTIQRVQECLQVIIAEIPKMSYRIQRSYATVLAFAIIVSIICSTLLLFEALVNLA